MRTIESICVFCGSATGCDPRHSAAAETLGRRIAGAGRQLVFGGGNAGLMGALANAALAAGGEVTGVIPDYLVEREHAHAGVTRLITVDSMHRRKEKMFELSDAFIVLPGGVGTLDETFEVITWKQLGMHDKPIVVVDVAGYWGRLDALVAAAVAEGFAAPPTRDLYVMAESPETALDLLERLPAGTSATDPARL